MKPMKSVKSVHEVVCSAHEGGGRPAPGPHEGPSAERFRPEEFHRASQNRGGGGGGSGATLAPEEAPAHATLNQDGSVLDAAGGPVSNPVGSVAIKHHRRYEHPTPIVGAIGNPDHILSAEDGQTREQHAGFSGAPAPSDYGTSGALGGDASNIGLDEPQNF